MDKINLEYDDSLPAELHDMAQRSLRTAISFLDSQPRPMGIPAVEWFTPDWSQMQFIVGADTLPHGLFSRNSMSGWCVLTVRTNGDMVLLTDPLTTVLNVDLELSTTVAMVSILDGYYYDGIHFDRQLHRQLQYLDSVTATNKPARSLLDDFEQSQADQAEKERMAIYQKQYSESRRKRLARQAEARRIKPVAWYDNKYPKQVTVTHTAPPFQPCPPTPPKIHPAPVLSEDDQKALNIIANQSEYMQSFCTTEDHDM